MPTVANAFQEKRLPANALLAFVAAGLLALFSATEANAQRADADGSVILATRSAEGATTAPLTKRTIRRAMLHRGSALERPIQAGHAGQDYSVARLALGGAGGWLVGAALGASIGRAIEMAVDPTPFLPAGAFLGGLSGALVGTPLGTHLANGRKGNWLLGSLASIGAGVGSAVLLASILDTRSRVQSAFVVAVPLTLQIGTSVAVERATAR